MFDKERCQYFLFKKRKISLSLSLSLSPLFLAVVVKCVCKNPVTHEISESDCQRTSGVLRLLINRHPYLCLAAEVRCHS